MPTSIARNLKTPRASPAPRLRNTREPSGTERSTAATKETLMSRYLIVMPDDSSRPILEAVNHAAKSLRIKMFTFSDPQLLHAVIAAHRRGVQVRVMLNPARRSGEAENANSRKMLADAGVEVIDSNPAFDLTHEKSMVVDDKAAWVMSLNWETRNFTETRDYGVVTGHGHEVAE